MSAQTPRSYVHHFGPGVHADHFLYRCYDADGRLLYIGCASNVARRISAHLNDHRNKASRWLQVSMARYEVEGPFAGRDAGRRAEAAAIQAEQPLFNFQERANEHQAAWMTRRSVVDYLLDHGHAELAVATTCNCDANDEPEWICYAHRALADIATRPPEPASPRLGRQSGLGKTG